MASSVNNVASSEKAESAGVCIIVITALSSVLKTNCVCFFSIPGPCVGHRNCGVREGT